MSDRASSPQARVVVFCQHGLGDPLVGPLMFEYIAQLQERAPTADVLLFTEEGSGAPVSEALLQRARAVGIAWRPLQYDVKGRQWRQRARNLFLMMRATRKHMRGADRRWLIGYLSYGGSYATVAKWIGLGRSVIVCFEPHSRYMVELGLWRLGSLKASVVSWFERAQVRNAHALIVPTRAVKELVGAWHARGRIMEQGITIDVGAAAFDARSRELIRSEHGFGTSAVYVYVGKFGGIYHSVERYARFMESVAQVDATARFMIIAQQDQLDRLRHELDADLRDRTACVPPVPHDHLHTYLSAADIGVVAIPPTPSQAYRTPVKSAHYWAAGLPLLIPRGVSDDARIAEERNVGVVVEDLPLDHAEAIVQRVNALLAGDRDTLRARCIGVAHELRDTKHMVEKLGALLEWGS